MKRTSWWLMVLVPVLLLATGIASAAPQPKGAVWAASDGAGTVSLFWIPKDLAWPAGGWRLERIVSGKAQVVAQRLGPGYDQEALARLSGAEAASITAFASDLKKGAIPREKRQLAVTVMGLSAAANPDFGLALGVRYQDAASKKGKRRYRLVALSAKGAKLSEMTSAEVDPGKSTPLPEAAPSLRAVVKPAGVELSWGNPKPNPALPVFAFVVERQDAQGGKVTLTERPLLITTVAAKSPPVRFTDAAPPKEAEASYRVFSLDLFGRRGPPRSATLFIPDLSALAPPAGLAAAAGDNRVELSWQAAVSPFTSGYVLERALLRQGPYLPLTPDGLDPDRTSWTDKGLIGGTSYFYRIRSMDPRGNLGPPSLMAAATPRNSVAPPRPDDLQAEVGRTRVRLTWKAAPFPVAGYRVERLARDASRWTILTPAVVPEATYDDHIGLHTQGEFRYRVVAVAFDNQESKPSREVKAILLDTVSPNSPRITDIDGRDGRVVVTFRAAPPVADVDSFLVVRSVSEEDPGLVIGDPLPAKAERFEDRFVTVGARYWYRLVAVDQSGNRSDPSWAREVTVLNPAIPAPSKPALKVAAEPLRHVRIAFDMPPEGLEVIVQRYEEGEGWRPLTGGIRNASEAADLNPPQQPKARYRLLYRAANGVAGPPSPEAEARFE
ncbi:MAG: fibronectin type III domain-containing protein [Deltaproteobacteria bacterium]|nr:fibronectin type III domain-containing protein [Deltaproteobacteria bacterium]